MAVPSLTASEARRIALAAQGFGAKRVEPNGRRIRSVIEKLGLLQIDSVNVLVRAHYLPLFSRLGRYDRAVLDQLAGHDGCWPVPRKRAFFEYWGHEASILPIGCQPLLRWRMARAEAGLGIWRGVKAVADARPDLVARIYDEIRDRGCLAASDLHVAEKSRGGWWGWSESKTILEWLFWTGRITAVGRRGFERMYDLPERVLPSDILSTSTPDPADAVKELTRQAASALGVATASDLRDYWRLPVDLAALALRRLVEDGELQPITVVGWSSPAFLARTARLPRRISARALLVPFDPLIFERSRTERLFRFRYRIEIYTPAQKRVHGYYVLPFLLNDRLVARVDLKADRAASSLLVRSAYSEHAADDTEVAANLAIELKELAGWLGLEHVEVHSVTPFSTELATSLLRN